MHAGELGMTMTSTYRQDLSKTGPQIDTFLCT
jgi:hypothetical protein